MPTRHKPKWGYQTEYLLSNDGIRIYEPKFLDALYQEFDIQGAELQERVHSRLEGAGNVYRKWRTNADEAPRPAERKAAIDELERLVDTLRDRLEQMDDFTATAFWRPETDLLGILGDEATKAKEGKPTLDESPWGHPLEFIKTEDGGVSMITLSQRHHFESLNILKNYCAAAREVIGPDAGGRPKDEGLRMWAINIRNLWEKELDRRFTLSQHKGEPVSDAAVFCVRTCSILEPGTSNARVFTAMRKAIQSYR